MKELPFTSKSMELIGDDEQWINGIFRDMTNTSNYTFQQKRDAYQEVIKELEAEHRQEHPDQPLLYPSNFVIIKARKPRVFQNQTV